MLQPPTAGAQPPTDVLGGNPAGQQPGAGAADPMASLAPLLIGLIPLLALLQGGQGAQQTQGGQTTGAARPASTGQRNIGTG